LGRKVHPYGFRLGVVRDWKAHWYAEGKQYASLLREDMAIRSYIMDGTQNAGISGVEIERFPNQVSVVIHTARTNEEVSGEPVDVSAGRIQEWLKKNGLPAVKVYTGPGGLAARAVPVASGAIE